MFVAGCPVRLYAGIKVAQHPRLTGPAIVMRSLYDERLLNAAMATMRALEWTGIASLDFVRDADGRYLLLEVNPRPWGSIAAASAAGVDFFAPLAAVLRGEDPLPELGYRPDVECAVLPLALLAFESWRSPRTLGGALRGFRADRGIWHPWRQATHLAHRLARVARNW
jgi:predicted ATP-grasp superfamily ATP-dependent carboligase